MSLDEFCMFILYQLEVPVEQVDLQHIVVLSVNNANA